MVPVPNYLKSLVKIKTNNKNKITLEVICPCSCNKFRVYKNNLNKSKEENEYERKIQDFLKKYKLKTMFSQNIELDENNEPCIVIRSIINKRKIKDKLKIKTFDTTEIVKIQCIECKKEYIIFDSRFNGYNANISDRVSDYDNKEYEYKEISEELFVSIELENHETYEQFIENAYKTTKKNYSNSFSYISIKGITTNNKNIKVLEYETS